MDNKIGADDSLPNHTSSQADDTERGLMWKMINSHLSTMDWAQGNSGNQYGSNNSRQPGHGHRRSEPNVTMIHKALPAQPATNNVPQSAPVQPGGFTLDWSTTPPNMSSQRSMDSHKMMNENSSSPKPASNVSNNEINGQIYPGNMGRAGDTSVMGGGLRDNYGRPRPNHVFDQNPHKHPTPVPPPYIPDNFSGAGSNPGSGSSSPFFKRSNSPNLMSFSPQPYVGSNTPPISINPSAQTSGINPGTQPGRQPNPHMFPSSGRYTPTYSPITSRRSSTPATVIDPRSHSASPNITRRSTSHSPALQGNVMSSIQPGVSIRPNIASLPNPIDNLTAFPPQTILPEILQPAVPTKATEKSTYDDQEYTKVLLQHQRERMERLRKELDGKKGRLNSLMVSVKDMERKVFQQKNEKISACMVTLHDVTKLREMNRQLEIDCNCMIKEVDHLSKSGNPMNKNFHDSIRKKSSVNQRDFKGPPDLPSPPLPPPPIPPPEEEQKWSCNYCTFLNHAALNKCEMCEYKRIYNKEHTASRTRSPQT